MKMPHREFRSGLISILARSFNVLQALSREMPRIRARMPDSSPPPGQVPEKTAEKSKK